MRDGYAVRRNLCTASKKPPHTTEGLVKIRQARSHHTLGTNRDHNEKSTRSKNFQVYNKIK